MSYESICNFLLITYWNILPVACVKMRQIWAKLWDRTVRDFFIWFIDLFDGKYRKPPLVSEPCLIIALLNLDISRMNSLLWIVVMDFWILILLDILHGRGMWTVNTDHPLAIIQFSPTNDIKNQDGFLH